MVGCGEVLVKLCGPPQTARLTAVWAGEIIRHCPAFPQSTPLPFSRMLPHACSSTTSKNGDCTKEDFL